MSSNYCRVSSDEIEMQNCVSVTPVSPATPPTENEHAESLLGVETGRNNKYTKFLKGLLLYLTITGLVVIGTLLVIVASQSASSTSPILRRSQRELEEPDQMKYLLQGVNISEVYRDLKEILTFMASNKLGELPKYSRIGKAFKDFKAFINKTYSPDEEMDRIMIFIESYKKAEAKCSDIKNCSINLEDLTDQNRSTGSLKAWLPLPKIKKNAIYVLHLLLWQQLNLIMPSSMELLLLSRRNLFWTVEIYRPAKALITQRRN